MATPSQISYIAQRARALGLDPNAVLAIAGHEGLGGGIGDHGTSFGPFQLHQGGALPAGIPLSQANTWAWSPAGINYALGKIAGVARGLRGRQAVTAISTQFERPANPAAEIADAMAHYGSLGGGSSSGRTLGSDPGNAGSTPALPTNQAALARLLMGGGSGIDFNSNQVQPPNLLAMAQLRQALGAVPTGTAGSLAMKAAGTRPSSMKSSGLAGGFLPSGATYKPGRLDQGHDFQTNPGGAIIAPGAGVVVAVKSDPHGFGPAYPIVHFTSGPYAGKDIYIGHTLSKLHPGQRFQAGQVISLTGTSPVGNAGVPGWAEIGFAPGGLPGGFGQSTPF